MRGGKSGRYPDYDDNAIMTPDLLGSGVVVVFTLQRARFSFPLFGLPTSIKRDKGTKVSRVRRKEKKETMFIYGTLLTTKHPLASLIRLEAVTP